MGCGCSGCVECQPECWENGLVFAKATDGNYWKSWWGERHREENLPCQYHPHAARERPPDGAKVRHI